VSDSDNDPGTLARVEGSVSELITAISAAKDRAEAAAVAAEQANAKANSESGFAYNAKQNAEEHAKAISQVRGTVDADYNWLTTTKANAEEAAQAISRAKVSSEADVELLAKAKSSAEQDASRAAAAQDRAEKAAATAENYGNALGPLWTRANEETSSVTQAKGTVEACATTVQSLQAQVTEQAAKAAIDALTITARETESKSILQSMHESSAAAVEAHGGVVNYKAKLLELEKQFEELRAKTESLLPGATSAGLASAFRDQKQRFDQPQKRWLWTFIIAVALLLLAGCVGLPGLSLVSATTEKPSWDTILRHLVNRLPLVVPVVWLGIYAGRNYMLALRMQEEYAFKEAISATFEGYKREMAAIAGAEPSALPILKLCENVLLTLAQRPGRIYEGQHEDITPLAPVIKAVGEVTAKITQELGDVAVKAMEKIKPTS
jgi:hypothetical protein